MIKKSRLALFPESRMLILKSFQDCFHNGGAKEFRFVFNPVAVAVNAQGTHLPVIEHQREPVVSFEPVFFISSGTPHQYCFSDSDANL